MDSQRAIVTTLGALSISRSFYASMIDMQTVTVSSKFQVVIPLDVRRRMKIEPGTQLMVTAFNGSLRMVPVVPARALRGIARGVSPDVDREPDRPL
jgi:AbrB family looped-hinge helix DNA binding protein